jgi:hypothetical protein
MSFLRKL